MDEQRAGGRRALRVLDEAECWGLLRATPLGRLAYTDAVLPAVVPVRFAVLGDQLVIAASPGSKVAAAARGAVVALEVDEVDAATRTGWSVTAVGPAHLMTDPHLAAELRAGGLVPWAPTPLATYLLVSVSVLSGRRLTAPGSVVIV